MSRYAVGQLVRLVSPHIQFRHMGGKVFRVYRVLNVMDGDGDYLIEEYNDPDPRQRWYWRHAYLVPLTDAEQAALGAPSTPVQLSLF